MILLYNLYKKSTRGDKIMECRDFPSAVLWAFGLRYSGDDRCDARRANGGKKSPIELLNAV